MYPTGTVCGVAGGMDALRWFSQHHPDQSSLIGDPARRQEFIAGYAAAMMSQKAAVKQGTDESEAWRLGCWCRIGTG